MSFQNSSNYQYFFHPDIFKTNEIIGRMGDSIKPSDALALGQTLGHMYFSKGHRIACVAYDERMSSFSLEEELCRGLAYEGLFVMRLGHCTTPVAHFTMKMLQAHLTIIVTGGDSPVTHNGFRIFDLNGPVCEDDLTAISIYAKIGFSHQNLLGAIVNVDAINIYQEYMIAQSKSLRDMIIVWNCDGGSIANLLQEIVHKIPGSHLLINDDPSEQTISETPLHEGIAQLSEVITEENASFGFLFNSDATALYVLDDEGVCLTAYEVAMIVAEKFTKKNPNKKEAPICCDATTSLAFERKMAEIGREIRFSNTGFATLMKDMIAQNACMSINKDGYISFSEPLHSCPDGLLAAITFLEFISESSSHTTLSEWRKTVREQTVSIPPLHVDTPFSARQALANLQNYATTEARKFYQLENATLRFVHSDGWWSASLGENADMPQIILHAEAGSKAHLNEISDEIEVALHACSIKTNL